MKQYLKSLYFALKIYLRAPYRRAWEKYKSGDAEAAALMMTGFMLGAWLSGRGNV